MAPECNYKTLCVVAVVSDKTISDIVSSQPASKQATIDMGIICCLSNIFLIFTINICTSGPACLRELLIFGAELFSYSKKGI